MRVLSLFSGAGGMDLGLEQAGHQIVGMCEIDTKAQQVLRHHWPHVPLHDDVTTLNGEDWRGRVDIVSGGSPCQDLSVAGRREGLDGARSGLFWHQCRIADQAHARWVVWENVAGALSSSNGADFAAVLWGLTGAHIRVPDGGWNSSGVVVGPKRWCVWRLFDAQYFGVPQRRRRVFIVAGAGSEPRPEILFEFEGSPWDSAQGAASGQAVAALTSTGVGTCGADDNQGQAGHLIPIEFGWQENQLAGQHRADGTTDPLTCTKTLAVSTGTAVRRLTPLECERLMGWPDHWTAQGDQGLIADSHRYQMCGNGVVAPVAKWIGNRL